MCDVMYSVGDVESGMCDVMRSVGDIESSVWDAKLVEYDQT
jgi:hypothetical protein